MRCLAVIATLSKGYDLDYIWKQIDPGPAKNVAGYYIQASNAGGEPPGRWWGPGAKTIGFESGEVYAQLIAAEPHATAERRRELRLEATRPSATAHQTRCWTPPRSNCQYLWIKIF